MTSNGIHRDRIIIRALEKQEEIATYPLPVCDVKKTLHTLVGLFPLKR